MKIKYDDKVDAAYLKLADSQVIDSEEISPGIIYDFDENNQVVGIEILKVKYKNPEQLKQINFPFSPEDRKQLKNFFGLPPSTPRIRRPGYPRQ